MSMMMPTPEQSSPDASAPSPAASSSRPSAKPQRVLACVLCQQRKIKCDRKFPCSHCSKAGTQCVPAAQVQRQRRRRFPERALLDRLRRYEALLRQNNIEFEPLHSEVDGAPSVQTHDRAGQSSIADLAAALPKSADPPSRDSTPIKSEPEYEAKNFWQAMNHTSKSVKRSESFASDSESSEGDSISEDIREHAVRSVWDELFASSDNLLFGSRDAIVALLPLHPEQVQIFRLWQIYLDNVNPLLKVTHTTTLQARIIEAASNISAINPVLEALMFSIYSLAILSLTQKECQAMFGRTQKELQTAYHFGCQQALLNCSVFKTDSRDCLTAFYLYLVSARWHTDPRSLSAMLGAVVRIAQRMGMHMESANMKCDAFEAEMRRRLWWSLVVFDARACEMSQTKATAMEPTWDCQPPKNVNDFDLRRGAEGPPVVHGFITEAIFTVVRSELADFVRHTAFHLDFLNPSLKPAARDIHQGPIPKGGELVKLEQRVENEYLKFCNPENPVHYMTIWTTRGYLARHRLLEVYAAYSGAPTQRNEAQRDVALAYAVSMLETDTKVATSPLTKGYIWFAQFSFPLIAYIHLVQDVKGRAGSQYAGKAWRAMDDNYSAHAQDLEQYENPFFRIMARPIMQAWAAREAAVAGRGEAQAPPKIVLDSQGRAARQVSNSTGMSGSEPSVGSSSQTGMPLQAGGPAHGDQGLAGAGEYGLFGASAMDMDLDQLDFSTIDWKSMFREGW